MRQSIERFFAAERIEPERIVVAASGGIDSSALLVSLYELGRPVVAVHVNHHLRGAESDADEAFVRALCGQLGVELVVADGTLDPEAVRARGVEAAAREVRYRLLRGRGWVATAHQKNDQAETVLMRLITGSGFAGLRGIHPVREDGILRPLLEVTRAELEAFLRERGIEARRDLSNDDPRFLRNRVRHLLRAMPECVEPLAAIARAARRVWPALESAIGEAERVCAEIGADETRWRVWPDDAWLRQSLLHRHIVRLDPLHAREVSADDLERLAKAATRTSVTKELELLPGNVLRRKPVKAAPFEAAVCAAIPGIGRVHAHKVEDRQSCLAPPCERPGPAGVPVLPFVLPEGATPAFSVRNRRPGDRFGHKKLKELFIDRKIPAVVRDRLPLLIWNGQVVWVEGLGVAAPFRATEQTAGARYEVWLER